MIDTFDLNHYLKIFVKQKFAMFLTPFNQKLIQDSKQLFKAVYQDAKLIKIFQP